MGVEALSGVGGMLLLCAWYLGIWFDMFEIV